MDRIWNERIRGTTKMGEISKKEGSGMVMSIEGMRNVWGESGEGGYGGGEKERKTEAEDSVNADLREKGLSGGGDANIGCVGAKHQ